MTDIYELEKEMTDNVLNFIVPYFEKSKNKAGVLLLLEDPTINLEKFVRLIIFGEYKQSDKGQLEYDKLKQDKFIFANMKLTLLEYRDTYNLKN
jgi:hypothetical protein